MPLRHHVPSTSTTGRRSLRLGVLAVVLGVTVTGLGAAPASAAVTTPSPGATVSGNVTITESRGGTEDCTFSNPARSRIEVRRSADNVVVHTASRNDSGALSTTWSSAGQPLGTYRVRSWAVDGRRSGFGGLGCTTQSEQLLSDHTVTLRNVAAVGVELPESVVTGEDLPVTVRTTRQGTGITGQALGGRSVTLRIPGADDTVVTTGADGVGRTSIDLPDLPAGTATVSASVASDVAWAGGTGSASTRLERRSTTTRYTGDTRAQPGGTATLRAEVVDATPGSDRAGDPVAGEDVVLGLGADQQVARTDEAGRARRSLVVEGSSRTEPVVARLVGGDVHASSEDSVTFYVGDTAAEPAAVEHGVLGGVTRQLATGLDSLLSPLAGLLAGVVQQAPVLDATIGTDFVLGDLGLQLGLPLTTREVLDPEAYRTGLADLLEGTRQVVARSGDALDPAVDDVLGNVLAGTPLADLYETARFRWRAVLVQPDGTVRAREHDATVGVPGALDVTGDGRPDVLASVTMAGDPFGLQSAPLPRIEVARLDAAPAELPLSLQAVFDLPDGDEEYRFGYDTREGDAPEGFRADLVLADGGAGVQVSTEGDDPIAVTGAIRPTGGADADPVDPAAPQGAATLDDADPEAPADLAPAEQRFAVTFDKAPTQARLALSLAGGSQDVAAELETAEPTTVGLRLADDSGGDELLLADATLAPVQGTVSVDVSGTEDSGLAASVAGEQGLDTLSLRATGLDAGRTTTDVLLGLTDVPRTIDFSLGADGDGGLQASGPIGVFEAGYASGGQLALLDDPAYLRLLDEAERSSVAVRLPGFEGMTVSLQDDVALDLTLAPTPLRALVAQDDLTLDATIDRAPRQVSLGLSPDGAVSVEGSDPIDAVSVAASAPDGILAGASRLDVRLTDVPRRFGVELEGDRVRFDTGGESIGLVEVEAHGGTAPQVPGTADGLLLDERGGATALAARIHGLREVSAELDDTPELLLDTVAGKVFRVDLRGDDPAEDVEATLDRLVPQMRLALTDDGSGATRLTYSAASSTNRLDFDLGGLDGSIAGPLPARLEVCMADDASCLPGAGIPDPSIGSVVFKASEYTTLDLVDGEGGLSASGLRLKRLDLTGDIDADDGGPLYLNTTDFDDGCGFNGCERPIRGGKAIADLGSARLEFTPGNGFSAVDARTNLRTRKILGQTVGLEGASGTGIVRCVPATALKVTVQVVGIPLTLDFADAICGVNRPPRTPPAG